MSYPKAYLEPMAAHIATVARLKRTACCPPSAANQTASSERRVELDAQRSWTRPHAVADETVGIGEALIVDQVACEHSKGEVLGPMQRCIEVQHVDDVRLVFVKRPA